MEGRSLATTIFATCVAFVLGAGLASAQDAPRTVVAPFEGRAAGAIRRAVERALEDRADLVGSDEAGEAAERAGVSGTAPGGVAELARAVGAELVVQGEVTGPRRAQRVALIVRGADGTELARGSATLRRGRRGQSAFARQVARIFDEAVRATPAPVEEPVLPPVEEEEAPEPEPAPASAAPEDGLALLAITAGLGVRSRNADVQLVPMGNRAWSGVFPEIVIGAEARPFALESHLGRGLFVQAAFAHSVGLGSRPDGTTDSVETNFVRFAVGAGWLAPIEQVAEVGVGLTVGYDGYHLGPNVVMPTAEYVFVRPAVRGRIRVMQEAFVIDAEIGYRGVVGVGAIGPFFGTGVDAHGVDLGVGVGGNLFTIAELGFTWSARLDWAGHFLSFSGMGSDSAGQSGSESSVRGTFVVGWSFR